MDTSREVFPNAPLVLVTSEIRLTYNPAVQRGLDDFSVLVRERFPVADLRSAVYPDMPDPVQQLFASNESRTEAVSLSTRCLTVESTSYGQFEHFSDTVRFCVEALVAAVPGVRQVRVGLRYLDEIRVPGIQHSTDWQHWVAPGLWAPIELAGPLTPVGISGQMLLRNDDVSTMFRWGEMTGLSVLSDALTLKAARPTDVSTFFVLDIDSFRETPDSDVVDTDSAMGVFDELHQPGEHLFRSAITERAIDLFRGTHDEE